MAKGTILDRLAGAMETLGKREGKALTPKQRVAATIEKSALTQSSYHQRSRVVARGNPCSIYSFA